MPMLSVAIFRRALWLSCLVLMLINSTEVPAQHVSTNASPWLLSLDEAFKQAKATNQPILIEFSGSDWCPPCVKLRQEVFDQPEFLSWAKSHLVLLRVDFPRHPQNLLSPEQTKANEAVKARYNPQGDFPLEVILSPDGKMVANSEGYRPGGPTAYIKMLGELMPELK